MFIIAGQFRHRKLFAPKSNATRPTTGALRESVFNICQHHIQGATFLDLYAGSGAMGFEALSRLANHAVFVDNNREALQCIKKNAQLLCVEKQVEVVPTKVIPALHAFHKQKRTFDIIYADPPYNQTDASILIEFIDRHALLSENGLLLVEESTEAAPEIKPFQTLFLKNSRRYGNTTLQIYSNNSPAI